VKIIACVKYSLDVSEMRVDPSSKKIGLDGVPKRLGEIDKVVLEEAARLKEENDGSLFLLTYGPDNTKDGLKEAMAMAVDEAVVVVNPFEDTLSTRSTVEVLAKAIEKIGDVDVIVCGETSDDGYSFQVGPMLAERLNMPQVTYAKNLKIDADHLIADRDLEECMETVKASLPAVVTVTELSNEPRRPTMLDALKAKKKKIDLWQTEADLGISNAQLEELSPLRATDIEGIEVKRKQVLINGKNAGEAIKELMNYLAEENVMGGQ